MEDKNTKTAGEYEKMVLIIKSQVRKWFKQRKLRMNRQSYRKINDVVLNLLESIEKRVLESKNKTVAPKHI